MFSIGGKSLFVLYLHLLYKKNYILEFDFKNIKDKKIPEWKFLVKKEYIKRE